jgi:HK97 family phage prohead protease
MQSKHKALSGLKITDASEGKVKAVFATLNVKDSDGDVTLAGAFKSEPVRISAYNHQSWKGALPVGKGVIVEDGDEVVLEGEFFLETAAGRETFEVVKQLGDLQEWSYGYDVIDSDRGTKDGENVRFLKEMKVHEVSPVILGAGVDTRTLAVKGKQLQSNLRGRLYEAGEERWGSGYGIYVWVEDFDEAEGYAVFGVERGRDYESIRVSFTLDDNGAVALGDDDAEVVCTTTWAPKGATNFQFKSHITAVMAAVDGVADRAADVMAKRAEKGKSLGSESTDLLNELTSRVERLKGVLTPSAEPDDEETTGTDSKQELLRSIRLLNP